ncbi:MAG: hypothetical protein ACHQHN_11640 [Sphingobacteriales bacterium]
MKRLFLTAALIVMIYCSFCIKGVIAVRRVVNISAADTIILPENYTSRKFLTGDAASSFNAIAIPGNIVKYDSVASTYEFETMTALIKGGKPATMQAVNSTVFNGTVPSDSKFNGSPAIDGIKADKNQVIDVEIKDDATYAVPDGQVDTGAIRLATIAIDANSRKKIFYIKSATVSIINYKVHAAETTVSKLSGKMDKLTKPDTAKKGISIKPKASGKPSPISSSGDNTKAITDKIISVQLIPVDNFFSAVPAKK